MVNFYGVQVDNDKAAKGCAKVVFLDIKERGTPVFETYDVDAIGGDKEAFTRWVMREFGYLRNKVFFL